MLGSAWRLLLPGSQDTALGPGKQEEATDKRLNDSSMS